MFQVMRIEETPFGTAKTIENVYSVKGKKFLIYDQECSNWKWIKQNKCRPIINQ